MRNFSRTALVVSGLSLCSPMDLHAGMPMPVTLTDVASARLDTLSFFAVVFLASALAVRFIWNRLRADFPVLPFLSYSRSLGLILLVGLLFNVVLTMISGARELLTPGAWEKHGVTYRLADRATFTVSSRTR